MQNYQTSVSHKLWSVVNSEIDVIVCEVGEASFSVSDFSTNAPLPQLRIYLTSPIVQALQSWQRHWNAHQSFKSTNFVLIDFPAFLCFHYDIAQSICPLGRPDTPTVVQSSPKLRFQTCSEERSEQGIRYCW